MKVAIIDADFLSRKNHRFPNLTAMKISGYWKERGAEVQLKHSYRLEWECDGSTSGWNVWYTMDKQDKTYVCKVFTDTPIPTEILEDKTVFYGGTGFFFDKAKPLPVEIEHHMPDYGLYTDSDMMRNWGEYYTKYSIGFLTRGCFRHCPFCVNQNSNRSVAWSPLEEFMDEGRPYLCFLDDNFFACRDWKKILQKVIMVAPDVYHLGDAILHHPHYRLEKEGVFRLPAALPGSLLQLPAVNDIPVENQPVAVNSAQELRRLLNFSVSGAKMHVRDDDCPVMWSFFHVHFMFSAPTGDFPMEQYRKPAETSSEGS